MIIKIKTNFLCILIIILFVGCVIPGNSMTDAEKEAWLEMKVNEMRKFIPVGYSPVQEQKDLYAKINKREDSKVIKHKFFLIKNTSDVNSEPITVEILEGMNNSFIRLTFNHRGKDLIYFNKAVIINANGGKLEFNKKSSNDISRVNREGNVYEFKDFDLSDDSSTKLLAILYSNNTIKIRLSGRYKKDYVLDKDRINALKDILELYLKKKNLI